MITYDLNAPGQKYEQLIEEIKNCSTGAYFSSWKSSYLIQSNLKATEIQSRIQPFLDNDDRLIIIEAKNHCSGWLEEKNWDYIKGMF